MSVARMVVVAFAVAGQPEFSLLKESHARSDNTRTRTHRNQLKHVTCIADPHQHGLLCTGAGASDNRDGRNSVAEKK